MFKRLILAYRKFFDKDSKYYRILDKIFGIVPNNIELYKLAFIHRSASLFLKNGTPINNERLEFLGDAVLASIVSDYLFIEFPQENEGFLTRMRSRIVGRATLNRIGLKLGLDKYLVVQTNNRNMQKHLFGDALEALIGALYLDKGYDFTNRLVINRLLKRYLDLEEIIYMETDYKSRLIEWSQKNKQNLVFHTEPADNYSDQQPHFICRICIGTSLVGEGGGLSKKEAEQNASQNVMANI